MYESFVWGPRAGIICLVWGRLWPMWVFPGLSGPLLAFPGSSGRLRRGAKMPTSFSPTLFGVHAQVSYFNEINILLIKILEKL